MAAYKYQLVSTSNMKLEKDGIVSINQPPIKSCPSAGECKAYCYACVGQQAMGNAKAFRLRAFELFKTDPKKFEEIAAYEIHRSGRRIIRWHDSGDIMNLSYLKMMARIANRYPEIQFYTYTKSIRIILKFGWENLPANLKLIQSHGGKDDHLIDTKKPFARIFLDKESIPKGFTDCSNSDYEAATSATKIAIVVHGHRKKNFKPKE